MASKNKVPVVEIFGPTIMGEGAMIGKPTWFVRTAACDYLGVCQKCDSMHAVDPEQFAKTAKHMSGKEIADKLLAEMGACDWVTISGGNPALWDLTDLVNELHAHGKQVCLETQGSVFKSWIPRCDLVHIAPKGPGMTLSTDIMSFKILSAFMQELDDARCHHSDPVICIKIPVFNSLDLDFAETVATHWPMFPMSLSVGNEDPPSPDREVGINFLQSSLLIRYNKIIDEVMRRPTLMNATILPQMHVLLWGNKQGV